MKPICAVLALAAALAVPAVASAAPIIDRYSEINAVSATSTWIEITGVLEGGGEQVTRPYSFSGSDFGTNCQRAALLMMTKPGRFVLIILRESSYTKCTLSRRV